MPLLQKVAKTFLPSFIAKNLGIEESTQEKQTEKSESILDSFAGYQDKIKLFLEGTFGSAEAEFDQIIDTVIYKSTDVLPFESAVFVDNAGQAYPTVYPTVGKFAELAFPLDPENTNLDIPVQKVVSAFMGEQENALSNFKRDLEDKNKAELAAQAKARAKARSKYKQESEEEPEEEVLVRIKNDAQMIAAAFKAYSNMASLFSIAQKIENPDAKCPLSEQEGKDFMNQAKEARLLLRGLADVYSDYADSLREVAVNLAQTEIKLLAKVPEKIPETTPARRKTV